MHILAKHKVISTEGIKEVYSTVKEAINLLCVSSRNNLAIQHTARTNQSGMQKMSG